MKFDVVIANPPYQKHTEKSSKGKGKGIGKPSPIWHHFVSQAFSLCRPQGYVCMIHPSNWRDTGGMFSREGKLIRSKDVKYLEIHDYEDGSSTFGMRTRYDWYVAQNSKSTGKTTVQDEHGLIRTRDISGMEVIPNGRYEDIEAILAGPSDERLDVIHDCTYHAKNMSDKGLLKPKKSGEFRLPCLQNVNVRGEPSCTWWSKTDLGHFGIPKVIFGSTATAGAMLDMEGKYGMCQACGAITSDVNETLPLLLRAVNSRRFINLISNCGVSSKAARYNPRVMALLRRDFWREFVDEDGSELP